MTRKEFIDLMSARWDFVPTLIQVRTPLTRVCSLSATEAFMHEQTGEAVQALRAQLLYMSEHGTFNFDD